MVNNLSKMNNYNMLSTKQAIEALQLGKTLIFPTETFFAIGCNISQTHAVQQIFTAKQRPMDMPLPIIVGNKKQLSRVAHVPKAAVTLLDYFWPGPLTVVLQAKEYVPEIISAHTKTIAVRISSHPLAQKLTQATEEPLIATSANLHKTPPATKITELNKSVVTHAYGIISKMPLPTGGSPSTIIAIQNDGGITILRDGAITKQQLITQIQQDKALYFTN